MTDTNYTNIQEKETAQKMLQSGEFEKARVLLEHTLHASPDDLEALSLLAALNGRMGCYDAAISCCQRILEIQPLNTDALRNMAQALIYKGRVEDAIPVYEKVAGLLPVNADIHNNLGALYMTVMKFPEAAECFDRAIGLQPDFIDPRLNLGRIFTKFGHSDKAINAYQGALHHQPDNMQARHEIADALMTAGKLERAEIEYKQVLDNQPEHSGARAGLALLYKKGGNFEKSLETLKPVLESGKVPPLAGVAFANIARHFGLVDQAIKLLENIIATEEKEEETLSQVHTQLGKLFEVERDYEKSFHHYQKANQLQRSISDPLSAAKQTDRSIDLWTQDFARALPVACHGSEVPVFIVGLPRSGTSLVEQILASHPDVFGAGELHALPDLISELPGLLNSSEPYPRCLGRLTRTAIESLSYRYLEKIKDLAAGINPLRITDKMPSNFLHIGLIKLLFPDARIIHCVRDPIDTCLSIYFNPFPLAAYTTDLNYLGTHYLKYKQLMKHWKDVLGLEVMDICYESLIDNPEQNIRNLVDYCGLHWDEACLNFHASERFVNTLSHEQVRRPLYRDSIKRWKNYEQYIQPLIKVLNAGDQTRHNVKN